MTLEGSGKDENETNVSVRIQLEKSRLLVTNWRGHYEDETINEMQQMMIQGLEIQKGEYFSEFFAQWEEEGIGYRISGTLGNRNQKQKIHKQDSPRVKFTMTTSTPDYSSATLEKIEVKYFDGQMNSSRSRIKGSWGHAEKGKKSNKFDFTLADEIPGTLQFIEESQSGLKTTSKETIKFSFETMEIKQADGQEK